MKLSADVQQFADIAGIDVEWLTALCRRTLDEDLQWGPDVTTLSTVPSSAEVRASLTSRASGTLAGAFVAAAVIDLASAGAARFEFLVADGSRVERGTEIVRVIGPAQAILTAERSALNLVCRLSGTATLTRQWVDAIAGTKAKIRDTRKTTPGLRPLEKYAVRCGGGENHRMGLGDAALVKDNHVAAAGGIAEAFARVRQYDAEIPVEVECDTLEQVQQALDVGADLILLDNMSLGDFAEAIRLREAHPGVRLEASGGLTLTGAARVAALGIDYLAVGALTHSAPILDLGLDT